MALRTEPTDLLGSPGTPYVSQELHEEINPGICVPDKDLFNTDTDMPDAADDEGFMSQFDDTGQLLTVVYCPSLSCSTPSDEIACQQFCRLCNL